MSDASRSLRGKRILLAEDDADFRRELASVLSAEGAEVEQAGRGDEALEHLAARSFDLLITDVVMPTPEGTQLAAMARTAGEETPILIITAHRHQDARELAGKLDRGEFLFKPFGLEDFLARVHALID